MRAMRITVAVAAAVLVLGVGPANGEDQKTAKPIGTWVREVGDNKITFNIKADELTVTVETSGNKLVAESSYGVTKSGTLFGIITKKTGEGGPAEGDLFSFKAQVDKNTLTISELKPDNPEAKQLVEGEYKKK